MRSLRARLLVLLSVTVLLAWLATALFSYIDTRRQLDALHDAHLAQSAALLMAQIGSFAEQEVVDVPVAHGHEGGVAFQIWEGDTLRLRSNGAPTGRMSAMADGFGDSLIDGARWRVYSRSAAAGRYVVQVGELAAFRETLAADVAGHLLHPLIIALPVMALLIWFSIGWGLAPLRRLARDVERRAPENLALLDEAREPREALPLLHALNRLFERLRRSLEQERRFTADAAHELRTPLAAIKTHAQLAQRASVAAEREGALDRVVQGVDRTAHLVQQLLTLARLDPATGLGASRAVSLDDVAANCITELAPTANVDIGLDRDARAVVQGDATLLGILLRNLIDNAIRYTPAGGRVTVSTARQAEQVVWIVADTGPGIPEVERERVLERFYRVLGTEQAGSGLGLSIVQRIAALHGATLRLLDAQPGPGLRVEVSFPAIRAV